LLKKKIRLSWMVIAFILPGTLLLIFVVVPPLKMALTVSPDGLLDTLDDAVALRSIWLPSMPPLLPPLLALSWASRSPTCWLAPLPGKGLHRGLINVHRHPPYCCRHRSPLRLWRNYLVGRAFGSVGLRFVDSLPASW
jgi:hypothetical protein